MTYGEIMAIARAAIEADNRCPDTATRIYANASNRAWMAIRSDERWTIRVAV